jgi:LysR family transcriptional activator of mexEF-oprN operon
MPDDVEVWLLPGLLDRLAMAAPRARVVVVPVLFRTAVDALTESRVDVAVTVADETPRSVARMPVWRGGFVCLYDPAFTEAGRTMRRERYLSAPHVIVSYAGDLRGVVEDALGLRRNVVCSTPRFAGVGALVAGSDRIATVPELVARRLLSVHRGLRACPVPVELETLPVELLWRRADDADPPLAWLRGEIAALVKEIGARRDPARLTRRRR